MCYTHIVQKLSFHGAAGTVTGSCFLLQDQTSKVLIDCGLFQGSIELEELNHAPFGFDPTELTGMLLTHAHLDHCGRIGKLVKEGFSAPIYMTAATHALLEITLADAAHVMESHREVAPLYGAEEVEKTMSLCHIIEYNQKFSFAGYEIVYVNAGHILGSASITVTKDGQTIAFSGDLGNSPQDIIQPTEYIKQADIVVMESTYGNKNHPDEDPSVLLQSEINAVEQSGGALLIPAFSLERTQELLHRIDHLKQSSKVKEDTPVFMDSPMAIRATDVFRRYVNLYNSELKSHVKNDDPFSFPGLQVVYRGKDSASIKEIIGPKVIIAGSGMMTGGRILAHAIHFLPQKESRLLIVGYQAENTPGRALQEGAKVVTIEDQEVSVKAHVSETQAMSSHADQTQLLHWFNEVKGVKRLFLIHGEDEPRETLKNEIHKKRKDIQINTPHIHEEVVL